MEAWLKASLASQYIVKVDAQTVQRGVFCAASPSPWYDDGVVFDWTALHQRLVRSAGSATDLPYSTEHVSALARFGCDAVSSAAPKECFATVVELAAPWSIQPLSEQAQDLSIFDVPRATSNNTSSAPKCSVIKEHPQQEDSREFYKFLRGPPGQRTVRNDVRKVLASVEQQLRQSGVRVFLFLSSFAIVCDDFTELLHRTAAVFHALTDAGFTVDGHGSNLAPRSMQRLRVRNEDGWTTLSLEKLSKDDDVAHFLVALFYRWLQDAYAWGCTIPLRLLPRISEGHAAAADSAEKARGVALFEKFVRGLVAPQASAIGLVALVSSLPENGGTLLELAAVALEQKQAPVGPQRWSWLELRLVLCQIGAYQHVPPEYLSQKA